MAESASNADREQILLLTMFFQEGMADHITLQICNAFATRATPANPHWWTQKG
jgi:hypothetical protein